MNRIMRVATLVKEMTYDEIMEMASWFSCWTIFDAEGSELDKPTIDPDQMASNINDWADRQLEEDK